MNRPILRRAGIAPAILAAVVGAACSGNDGTGASFSGGELPDGTVFLVQSERPDVMMQALFTGTVVRDEQGCLRSADGDEPATIVWPYGARLERRHGELYVEDESGQTLGRVGGPFRFGGGYVPSLAHASLSPGQRALADARCPGQYFIVGETNVRS